MVKFKSIPAMYEKEKSGIKPNTVRIIDEFDDRFKRLYENIETLITIENTHTKETFTRKVRDVSVWNNLMIISWEHEDDSEHLKNETDNYMEQVNALLTKLKTEHGALPVPVKEGLISALEDVKNRDYIELVDDKNHLKSEEVKIPLEKLEKIVPTKEEIESFAKELGEKK